jgi:molecular chaperone GrpE
MDNDTQTNPHIEPTEDTSDVSPEESDIVVDEEIVAEESAQESIAKLREKLKKAVAEKQEYLDGWQRTKAEFVNVKKRFEDDAKELRKYANEGLIDELLPVLQSFDMAMGNKEAWEKVDPNWRVGVEYIYNQLRTTLESNGLKEINPLGLPFDPMRDEAIEHTPVTDPKQNNVVMSVIQKGYTLNGKSLRAPKVKVGEIKQDSVSQ